MVAVAVSSPATLYAQRVTDGEIVAGPWVRKACQRHLDDLERGDDFPYEFREDAEAYALDAAAMLYLDESVPFVAADFQQFIIGALFGWVHRDTGWRRFRTAYVEIGKGNGKSPMAAIIGLIALAFEGEVQAEIYCAAVTRDQAGIMLTDALNIAKSSPVLESRVEVLAHQVVKGSSYLRAVSAEGRSLDGKRPYVALIDEIHEHPSDVVVAKMRAGMKRRMQPLIFEITNSGFDRESVCFRHHQHSIAVVEGTVEDETWFAYVAALDEGDEFLDDPSVWIKANPGLGTILPELYLAEQVKEAKNIPSSANLIARLNFCVWTQSSTKWLDLVTWRENEVDDDFDFDALARARAFGGLDLSTTTDLTAFALYWPSLDFVRCWFWLPEEASHKRYERAGVPYPLWADNGWINLTPGNVVDYDVIEAAILDLADRYDIAEIGYDRWNSSAIVTRLVDDGAEMVPVGQGYASMSPAAKELEALVMGGKLKHDGNEVLAWNVGNAVLAEDPAGNIKPDRSKSSEKIDGLVAVTMAVGRAALDEGDAGWWVA